MSNYKKAIIDYLKKLRQETFEAKDVFRSKAYNKAIKELENLPAVNNIKDVEGVPGVGKRIKEKIQNILDQKIVVNSKVSNKQNAIETLSQVMAIGPVKAAKLVNDHNITTIDELRQHQDLLNDKQRLGLKYHEDFLERIPRKEMDKHDKLLQKTIEAMSSCSYYVITGSYRRGLESSGDIDVLVTHPTKPEFFTELVQKLKDMDYLKEDFAFGKEKYMGTCKLPKSTKFRRIDIMFIPCGKFPFALLYFTGSQKFNIKMRTHALAQGYSLNEHGLTDMKTKKLVDKVFKTEEDIFKFLKYPWVDPTDRS